jgi:hypothetical protein
MTWRHLFDPGGFDRARRREAYRRFSRAVTRKEGRRLLPLGEVEQRLAAFERSYVGIEAIPVERIVGSADRTEDFDRDFLPLRDEVKDRWLEIDRIYPAGDFPPIVVYQVGEAYFVVDGHHRVALAKHKGVEFIDAEITRLHSRVELPADADIGHLIRAEQERLFMEESGLAAARPGARIPFSRAAGYPELLELVKAYAFDLVRHRSAYLSREEAAAQWFENVYRPTIEAIRNEGLLDLLEGATEADVFLLVHQRRRALFPERGEMSVEEAVGTVADERRPRRTGR